MAPSRSRFGSRCGVLVASLLCSNIAGGNEALSASSDFAEAQQSGLVGLSLASRHKEVHVDELREKARRSIETAEAFADGLKHFLVIEKISAAKEKKSNSMGDFEAQQRKTLDAELDKLRSSVGHHQVAGNRKEVLKEVRSRIRLLNEEEARKLREETHRQYRQAAMAARGAQMAARAAARKARKLADKFARKCDDNDDDVALARSYELRSEAAASEAERYTEDLARNLEDSLDKNLEHAEKRAEKHAEEREHAFKEATRRPPHSVLDAGDASGSSTSLIVQPVADIKGLHPLASLLLLASAVSFVVLVQRRHHSAMELPLLLE